MEKKIESDVVVVGYGGAGATAAITAHDNGAGVTILEKMPTGGGKVILACGGFEYNEAMKKAFLPFGPVYAFGHTGNTGDGIIMAQKVGAALWHMTTLTGYLGFKTTEYEAAFPIRIHGDRFIYVDGYGRRFHNETGTDDHHGIDHHDMWRVVSPFDPEHLRYPRIPTYAVFDAVTAKRGPLYQGTTGANQHYKWSHDNYAEIAKGWIHKGETIGELAVKISVNRATLEDTILKYNEFCRTGTDADIGRSQETLGPIETPPFFAIPLWPCMLNTQGGPRRDKDARVLNSEGKPIPRLYSAGELGSLWGFLYQGCGNISECLAFGRIAGRNAALEKPLP